MRKNILYFLLLLALASCSTAKFSKTGEYEKALIGQFLSYMKQDNGPQYENMMNAISPDYIVTNQLDKSAYKVNNYSILGYNIESYERGSGKITATIWGDGKRWTHRVVFKLVKIKGKYYIEPSKHSDKYIDPWQSVELYIKGTSKN